MLGLQLCCFFLHQFCRDNANFFFSLFLLLFKSCCVGVDKPSVFQVFFWVFLRCYDFLFFFLRILQRLYVLKVVDIFLGLRFFQIHFSIFLWFFKDFFRIGCFAQLRKMKKIPFQNFFTLVFVFAILQLVPCKLHLFLFERKLFGGNNCKTGVV